MDAKQNPRRISISIPHGMELSAVAEALSPYALGRCAYCNPTGTHGIRPLGPRRRTDGRWDLNLDGQFWIVKDPGYPNEVSLYCENPTEFHIISAMQTLFEWKYGRQPKTS